MEETFRERASKEEISISYCNILCKDAKGREVYEQMQRLFQDENLLEFIQTET